uniref:NADH-ubiquinone oxidoreductase chain 2 n=1 Tax=Platynereis cf. australis PA-2020 TaxID=2759233 RepID=A0A7G9UIZ4_9ANNE|nr:NADH dehydrogenase subunit 2 [Platynereis cf. australis PA-2020]QNN93075.1 NADH dehydrogenase subunit 2 [Platynereis cf. australis PA-2020]
MTPSSLLFLMTTITGTIIALSSTNWLYLWMGMELNLLSFVPLIASSQHLQETEASVKYFIIQAIGSGVMLTAGVLSMTMNSTDNKTELLINFTFLLSMTIKLGLAPCHQWLPHVMASMPWNMCLILSTWQKISPFMMLTIIAPRNTALLIMSIAMLSAMVGGMGGMNQSQLRTLLAYSSIGHMGWMLVALNYSSNMFIMYFSIYVAITTSLMYMLTQTNMLKSNFNTAVNAMSTFPFMMLMLMMFSLGGLPPFLGFLPKWMIINSLTTGELFIVLTTLITGSLMNLFYYFNMTFNFILSMKNLNKTSSSISISNIALTSMCTLAPLIMFL